MDIEGLKRARTTIKGKLTRFESHLNSLQAKITVDNPSLSPTARTDLELRLPVIIGLRTTFDELQLQIGGDDEEAQFLEFEPRYYHVVAVAKNMLSPQSALPNVTPPRPPSNDSRSNSPVPSVASNISFVRSNNGHAQPSVKLPQINLPEFNGNADDWLNFRDLFTSLIDNNENLDDVIKLHYLRGTVKGKAADIIRNLPLNSSNYEIAWKSLVERYNNTKSLSHSHLKALFEMDSITKESSVRLRSLVDSAKKHVRSLDALVTEEKQRDLLLVYVVSSKLDQATIRDFEKHSENDELPMFDELISFLESRASVLETIEQRTHKVSHERSSSKSFVAAAAPSSCPMCKSAHKLQSCDQFKALSERDKYDKVKQLKCCINCLRKGHFLQSCPSKGSCRHCSKRHHSLLHADRSPWPTQPSHSQTPSRSPEATAPSSDENISNFVRHAHVLMPTAMVDVSGSPRLILAAKVLLDSGSSCNIITLEMCQKLKLKVDHTISPIVGVGNAATSTIGTCNLYVRSKISSFKIKVACLVLPEITSDLPRVDLDLSGYKIPSELVLADPSFATSSRIDLLLGSEVFFSLMLSGQHRLGHNMPVLQNTQLGWVIAGPIPSFNRNFRCSLVRTDQDAQEALARFWKIEEVASACRHSPEEVACEEQFTSQTRRNPDGRFVVKLPLREDPDVALGESFFPAQKQFFSLERRLNAKPQLQERYIQFMDEYLALGHMSPVADPDEGKSYFLPHHGVEKAEAVTTKLRVVFNASQNTSSGQSLNSIQMVGPVLQQDLFYILLRFRRYRYALASDVQMMYRQVLIDPEQRSLQRILWRRCASEPLQAFNLNTVTYGTAAASFLAIRCVFELANQCEVEFPRIAEIIRQDSYVDDFITGGDTLDEAKNIVHLLPQVLSRGKFKLRKWLSNDPATLEAVEQPDMHPGMLDVGSNENTKTLGLLWDVKSDSFAFAIPSFVDSDSSISKRMMLSDISQIFDPLGLLGPSIILAKILLQELWLEKISWDDPVPIPTSKKWISLRADFAKIDNFQIRRHVICDSPKRIELHGFCDASKSAYVACLYMRSIDENDKPHVHLWCSKTKVAPLKPTTIPRLELLAAVLLSSLLSNTMKHSGLEFSRVVCWTDSSAVLGWIKTQPYKLKTFEANRVAQIQDLNPECEWRHVRSKLNPADVASRGMLPTSLICHEIWWQGPPFLTEDESSWPILRTLNPIDSPNIVDALVTTSPPAVDFTTSLFKRFSSFIKMKRSFAYMLRFIYNCRCSLVDRKSGPLSTTELNESLVALVKLAQAQSFESEIKTLIEKRPLKGRHLLALSPLIDRYGIVRVGGRLRNAPISYDKRHPILLSHEHPLARLICESEHLRLLHAGPQQLIASLNERFWILGVRKLARMVVFKCVRCFRASPRDYSPVMGHLPSSRLEPVHPFHTVGVDYAGPILIKDRQTRGAKMIKSYICLYICFTTKAIHLELVTSLTTEAFLSSFRRFISRRGKPSHIYSDNGTNFIGASNALNDLYSFLKSQSSLIINEAAEANIQWHFIPPHSPHFGGLWESNIKCCKLFLRKLSESSNFDFEQYYTLLCQVEAILNSRPLTPLSADPEDLSALTPSHFLVGRTLTGLPCSEVGSRHVDHRNVHKKIEAARVQFWERWRKEYLCELQRRTKWQTQKSSPSKGQLVLIKDPLLPPLAWRLGRIQRAVPGKDGVNRVAVVKTATGEVLRSFAKLCPLPMN